LVALVLIASFVLAVPDPPLGIDAEFVGVGVRISWQHEGGQNVSYNVYRGPSVEQATLLTTVSEKTFTDQDVEVGIEYVYFVTASDATGEGLPALSISVIPQGGPSQPFSLTVVSPEEGKVFVSGQDFYVGVLIQSPVMGELKDLTVFLVSEELGVNTSLFFDEEQGIYLVSVTAPEAEFPEGISATYSVWATVSFQGQEFSDSKDFSIRVVPAEPPPSLIEILSGFFAVAWPWIIALIVIGVLAYVAWQLYKKKKSTEDRVFAEFVDVLKERAICRFNLLNKKINSKQFGEKERPLQKRQKELEAKLGLRARGLKFSTNPFAGFDMKEINEVAKLVKEMVAQKKDMSRMEMEHWLVNRGRKEKVAKKVVQLIYGK